MPFTDKNQLPKPLNKPQDSEKLKNTDKSVFSGGKSRVFDYNIDKQWKRDPAVRKEIENILRVGSFKGVSPAEIDKEIDKLQQRIDINKDKSYTPSEVVEALRREYWNQKHDITKKSEGGLTPQERREVKMREEEDKFLEEKFKTKK